MNGTELFNKVHKKEIKDGTKYNVYDNENNFIGRVGVIETSIVFLKFNTMPKDLYTEDYTFVEEEEKELEMPEGK